MTTDQIVSLVEKVITAIGSLMVTLGIANSAQEGPVVAAMLDIVGALGVLLPTLNGIWRHNTANTVQAAAKAITASPTPDVVAPVVQALRAQGASVNTTGLGSVTN